MANPRDPDRDQTTPRSDDIDESSEESFPASDPPSWTPTHPGPPDRDAAPGGGEEPRDREEERR